MPSIDSIERKYLFRLTRFVALFFIAAAIVPVVFGAFHFTGSFFPKSIAISESEISEIITPVVNSSDKKEANKSESYNEVNKAYDPLSGLKIPFSVQKYISTAENMEALRNWATPMNRAEKEELLRELEVVIKKAEEQKLDVAKALNHYWEVKNVRLTWRNSAQSANDKQNYIYAGVVGTAIITIAIFSLVLVLLAIERNTRK